MSRANKAIIIITASSFLLSLAYSFNFQIKPAVDARAYDAIAQNLAAGRGFREDAGVSLEKDTAMLRAGPGYEFFLAGIYTVFGHNYPAVWITQAILHALSAWLIYLIACRVFETTRKPPIIAAALFAFWPDLIEISAMLMTETLYLFFTVLTIYIFVRAYQSSENLRLSALLGVATGLAILTRPTILLFVPVFIFFYYHTKQYRCIAIYLVSFLTILIPWTLRNYALYHQVILTTLIGEYNLWIGNTLASDGGQIAGGHNPVTTFVAEHGISGLHSAANAAARTFVLEYPGAFIKLCLTRFIRFFSLIRPMGFWFYQYGLSQAIFVASSTGWIVLAFVTGFAGMVAALTREKKEILRYLAAFAITAPLPLLLTVVQSRYRFQVYPFLAIFAAYFIVEIKNKRLLWRDPIFLFPTAGFIIITLIDTAQSFSLIIQRLLVWV